MAAGTLRHLLTLEQRTQVADGAVGITTAYTTVTQVWGDVQATRGAVYLAGLQIGEGPTHRIVIRYRPRTTFDHVSAGARRWRVRDVRDPDGRRKWLEIMAEELQPETGA
jgi:SPP1 family predicted phage head-tail adaptor